MNMNKFIEFLYFTVFLKNRINPMTPTIYCN